MDVRLRKCAVLLLSLVLVITMGLGIVVSGAENVPMQESVQYAFRVLGDVDGNGKVDAEDVISVLLHISMPEIFPVDVNVDYNGDDTVDADDALRLLLYVSMPGLFPLHGEEAQLRYCAHCGKEVAWRPFTGQTSTDHYVLVADMVLENTLVIGLPNNHNTNVVIDLNGHTVEADESVSCFAKVYAGLSIMDTSEAQTGTILATNDNLVQNGGLIRAFAGAKINLYSGTLTAAEGAAADAGGLVNMGGGTFNMYGGTITGGTAVAAVGVDEFGQGGTGGNLYIGANAIANIYGGEISNGKAISGVVEVFNGETGEVIRAIAKTSAGEEARGMGGNIYNAGKLYIGTADGNGAGAVISGGTATQGGNIYAAAGFTVYKDGKVSDGVADAPFAGYSGHDGGNVYLSSGCATVLGEVSNGTAYNGGNFGCSGESEIYLDGGKILRGRAEAGYGGNIDIAGGVLRMENDALVADGVAAVSRAGNICCRGGADMYITDSTVSGGQAGTVGGNIYLWGKILRENEADKTSVTGYDYAEGMITNSVITGGTAGTIGGNIITWGADLTISGGEISAGVGRDGGNLYIAGDTDAGADNTFRSVLTVIGGAQIVNGKTTTTAQWGGGNIYAKNTDVKITDSTVSGGAAVKKNGGNIYAANDAIITLVGARIDGGQSAENGGNIYLTGGSSRLDVDADSQIMGGASLKEGTEATYYGGGNLYITGNAVATVSGKITDGKSNLYGGNVLMSNGDLVLADGAFVCDGKVGLPGTAAGGNICKWNNGTLDIQAGATVSGGMDKNGASTDVYANNAKRDDRASVIVAGTVDGLVRVNDAYVPVTVSGNAKIGDMDLRANLLVVGKMTEGAQIKIRAKEGVFTNVVGSADKAAEYARYFVDVNGVLDCGSIDGQLAFGEESFCPHCGTDVIWKSFDPAMTSYKEDTHVKLRTNVTLSKQLQIGAQDDDHMYAVLDLDGYTITINSGRFALVYDSLHIIDSSDGQTGVITTTNTGATTLNGGLLLGAGGCDVNLYGGMFKVPSGYTAANGGIVHMSGGIFNMYGGTIRGGTAASGSGGNVYVGETGLANIFGGVIENGTAAANGGNIYALGRLNIEGDAVIRNGAAVNGGNIYDGNATNILGGTISNGKASNNGGNIYHGQENKCEISVGVGVRIENGTAKNGGNIYADYTISVRGGVITGGIATGNGGNIWHDASLIVGVSSGANYALISDGRAVNGGNIYGLWYVDVYKGATVSGGVATESGGNIYGRSNPDVTIDGGKVIGGTAGYFGGNIYIVTSKLYLKNNAEVADGRTTSTKHSSGSTYIGGGNIYAVGSSTKNECCLEIVDATVSGGVSAAYGGNILSSKVHVILGEGAVVTGGQAGVIGASICKWNGSDMDITAGAVIQPDAFGNGAIYMNNSEGSAEATLSIAGDVQVPVDTDVSAAKLVIKVSGAAKITDIALYSGNLITVGELTEGADIRVSNVVSGKAFTTVMNPASKAAEYAQYFRTVDGVRATAKNGVLVF